MYKGRIVSLFLCCLLSQYIQWADAVGAKLVFQDALFSHEPQQNTTAPKKSMSRKGGRAEITSDTLRTQKNTKRSESSSSSSKNGKGSSGKKSGKKDRRNGNIRSVTVKPFLLGLLVKDLPVRPPSNDVNDLIWVTEEFYARAFAKSFRESFHSLEFTYVDDYMYTETFGNFNYLLNLTAQIRFDKTHFRFGLKDQVVRLMKDQVNFQPFVNECVRDIHAFHSTISATAIIPSKPSVPTAPTPVMPVVPTPAVPTPVMPTPPAAAPVSPPVDVPSPTASPSNTVMPIREGFDITLDLSQVPEDSRDAFVSAADRWTQVIVGDLESVAGTSTSSCGDLVPEMIDDLFVCATVEPIDGLNGVLGTAGPEFARFTPTTIPYIGAMRFDSADIEQLKLDGTFGGVILHEMGHVLGLGTLWTLNNLQTSAEAGTVTPPCPYNTDTKASVEFQSISGCTSIAVPIEYDGGPGTQCGHWEEDCLLDELMTGFSTGSLPLSRITVASLEDIGYVVDYNAADPYTAANMNPNCVCSSNLLDKEIKIHTDKSEKEETRPPNNIHSIGGFVASQLFGDIPKQADQTITRGNDGSEEESETTQSARLDQTVMKHSTKVRVRGNGRRKLSAEGQQMALDYGKKVLRQNKELKATLSPEDAARYVGDQAIIVLYREHDEIFSIEVQAD